VKNSCQKAAESNVERIKKVNQKSKKEHGETFLLKEMRLRCHSNQTETSLKDISNSKQPVAFIHRI